MMKRGIEQRLHALLFDEYNNDLTPFGLFVAWASLPVVFVAAPVFAAHSFIQDTVWSIKHRNSSSLEDYKKTVQENIERENLEIENWESVADKIDRTELLKEMISKAI
jgi:hypothetical protein